MNNYQELKKAAKDEATPSYSEVHSNLTSIWHDLDEDETRTVTIPQEYVKDMSRQLDKEFTHNYCFDDGVVIIGTNHIAVLKAYQRIKLIGDGKTINWEV